MAGARLLQVRRHLLYPAAPASALPLLRPETAANFGLCRLRESRDCMVSGETAALTGGHRAGVSSCSPTRRAPKSSILAHELAHELLHRGERKGTVPRTLRETKAEAVACVVCQPLGFDTNTAAADYIQLYARRKSDARPATPLHSVHGGRNNRRHRRRPRRQPTTCSRPRKS